MLRKSNVIKFIAILTFTAGITLCAPVFIYLKVLPYAVSHPKVINYIENTAKKYADVDLQIGNPVLKTSLSPVVDFQVKNIILTKQDKKLLELKNLDTSISLAEILKKNIIVNRIKSEYIYADINRLTELVPKEEKKEQQSDWDFDFFDSLLAVKNCEILYTMQPDTHIHIKAGDIEINNAEKIKRFVQFKIVTLIDKADKHVTLAIADDKKVFISNKAIYIQNCPLSINKSKMYINAEGHKNKQYSLEVFSKKFNINDIIELIETQVVENNINEVLAYFSDLKGNFDFNFKLTNNNMIGELNLNRLDVKIVPVDYIPIALTKGNIKLDKDKISLNNFEGYYDNNPLNKLDFQGTVTDYLKSMDTDIIANAFATNDFFKKHLSKITGTKIELEGIADTKVMLKSKNNIIDLTGIFKLERGENIIFDGEALPFSKANKAMTSKMHFENMILDINSLRYYIESKDKQKRDDHKPIFSLDGSIDVANNNQLRYVGFEIPEPLPSEFFNAVSKQNIFKKGTVSGKLTIDNTGTFPVLKGSMVMDKVRVPSQRTFINHAELKAENNLIHMNAYGKYKRSDYKFTGDILNEIKFPIIVKDINLSLDYLDIYKLLTNSPQTSDQNSNNIVDISDTEDMGDGATDFDIGNLIIEKCIFNLKKGIYKDINFGNITANLTLDKNSILDIKSNRFDIAEGISTLKVNCDLKKNKYNLRLGIKDVNSDIIASSLLDLKKEITGKASGLIEINTDDSLKLNGSIKFLIENGTIQKVGLVEYVLKFAALFRNPLTMISPGMFSDLVNLPEGNFDKITGDLDLKNNVIEKIRIKSSSPQLSSYIAGRYDLETKDTSLRIYTKFASRGKGLTGFLRNISLNSLATRIPMSSRNDANYYSSELAELPEIEADEKDCQIFLTKVEGDVENNNFLSSLKKIK